MMQYDYYAYQQEQLHSSLNEIKEAAEKLKQAKKNKDRNARQEAEQKIETSAEKAVHIEPHLSYLWYESQSSDRKNNIRNAWIKNIPVQTIPENFRFTPDISEINNLPSLSFILRVPFKLQKPYLSKDDRSFHILDNPVRKDKVFRTPMVSPTGWKGALRATFWQMGHTEKDDKIIRLFGNAREDEKGQAGRLYFYPTFFDNMDPKKQVEVINPHSRKTGTGKNPILIECVPASSTGYLVILYVPFGNVEAKQVAEDLQLLTEGVEAMLTVYGFGAKTSSGFGVAGVNDRIEFNIRADWPELKSPEPEKTAPEIQLPRYLVAPVQINPEFLNPDGSFKSKERYLEGKSAKKAGQLYDKAKKWWDSDRIRLAEAATVDPIPKTETLPKITMTEVSFNNLSELGDRAREIANIPVASD